MTSFDAEKHFIFNHKFFGYFGVRTAKVSERIVEVSLGNVFCCRYPEPSQLLEIGNVMNHYLGHRQHLVVDLNEKPMRHQRATGSAINYLNEDVLFWEPSRPYEAALSLSTVEHTDNPPEAIGRILSWAQNVLITFPLGYQSPKGHLTTDLIMEDFDYGSVNYVMRRTMFHPDGNCWEQTTMDAYRGVSDHEIRYGAHCPTASYIGIVAKGVIV